MALPALSYVVNVSTNIAICTIIASPPTLRGGVQQQTPHFDLLEYEILVGSSGVGTVITFQSYGADSIPGTAVWRNFAIGPFPITATNSQPVNGIINGPLLGGQFLISGVAGNGIAYARLSASYRQQ